MTAPTRTEADDLLLEFRLAVNVAEHALTERVRDEAYRTAACAALALDRLLTAGGSPPGGWNPGGR